MGARKEELTKSEEGAFALKGANARDNRLDLRKHPLKRQLRKGLASERSGPWLWQSLALGSRIRVNSGSEQVGSPCVAPSLVVGDEWHEVK